LDDSPARNCSTPDFFVLRCDCAGWEEWKLEEELFVLAEKMPARYQRGPDGRWCCPPGEECDDQFGLYYRIRSSVEINWELQRNLRFLEDYFRTDDQQRMGAEAERRLDKKSQKKVLKQELNQPCPATLEYLAHRFGYTNSGSLRRRFPDLCQALMEKRRQYQQRQLSLRLNRCRKILNEALTEYPPPSLSSIARRFEGVRAAEFLRKHFRAECRGICERHIGYREKRMQNARDRLRQSLRESPPPSLNQLSKEIGYHMTTLQQCYPELSRSIMARYEDHIRKLRQIRVS
jgi:hypothetical protein